MVEEAMMHICAMHLCTPNYKEKEKDGWLVPSWCSYDVLSVWCEEKRRNSW